VRAVFLSVFLLLVAAPAATAQEALDRASEALREDPVYVDRDARDILSEDEEEELRSRIEERLTPSTLFVAVLPEIVGMTPEDAATEIGNRVSVRGSIAVIVGDRFQMLGSTTREANAGGAAFEKHGSEGAAPLLFAVVDELAALGGQRPAGGGGGGGGAEQEDGGGIGPVPLILLGLALAGAVAAAIVVLRRRRRAQPVQP
jgi:hypothetical protein